MQSFFDTLCFVDIIGSATLETRDQMGLMAVSNLEAGIQEKALPTSVYKL